MSKKDFIALADTIREHNNRCRLTGLTGDKFSQTQIERLADYLATTNPRFMRARWLGYIAGTCGQKGEKV